MSNPSDELNQMKMKIRISDAYVESLQETVKTMRRNRPFYILAGIMLGIGIYGLILIIHSGA